MSHTTEWIGAVGNAIIGLATVGLVGYAGRSYDEWQRQRKAEWWNAAARDILVTGNAFYRSCSSVIAQATGDVVARYWQDCGQALLITSDTSTEQLLTEQKKIWHDFMAAMYVGEFTWGDEIRAHYAELDAAREQFDSEVVKLMRLSKANFDDVQEEIFAIAAQEHENPCGTNDAVTRIGTFLQGLSETLRSKTYGTRNLQAD